MISRLSISQRLWSISVMSGTLFFIAVVVGWFGLQAARDSLKTVYEDRTVPLRDLGEMSSIIQENYAQVLLGYQHDPLGVVGKIHEHPTSLHTDAVRKSKARLDDIWVKYMATNLTDEEKRLADDFVQKRRAWVEKMLAAVGNLEKDDYSAEGLALFLKAGREERKAAMAALDALMGLQQDIAKEEFAAAEARFQRSQWWFGIMVMIGIFGVMGMTWVTLRRIGLSLRIATEMTDKIAAGDLTVRVPDIGSDELGMLMKKVSAMQGSLHSLIKSVQANVDKMNRAARDLADSADNSSRVSHAQSEAASGMAASVEELSVSIDQLEVHASEAHQVTLDSGNRSQEGGRVILQAAAEMRRIADAVNATAGTIRELDNYSGQISSIVNVIRDIADQTNLLALNAAIEAARAGEQGRGFAVVADEVRKLAERTSNSTQEITEMIGKIQQGTNLAVQEMEASVQSVGGGVTLANEAGESMTGISHGTERAINAVNEISSALKEQAMSARDIAQKVENIAQGAEENSSTVAQTATSAQQLEGLAGELHALTGRFRV